MINNHYRNFVEEIKADNNGKLENNRTETLILLIGIIISVLNIIATLSMIFEYDHCESRNY